MQGDTLVVTKPGRLARSLPPKVNGMPMVGYLAERIARGDSGEGWEHWKLVAYRLVGTPATRWRSYAKRPVRARYPAQNDRSSI